MGVRIDGLRLTKAGPNCWNGALLKAGLINSVRFVSNAEYWFWMNSPYCRQLGPHEEKQRGDLGSLFWRGQGHYHSFVYIDGKWVFSKNSPETKYPYEVQRFEAMFPRETRQSLKDCRGDKAAEGGEAGNGFRTGKVSKNLCPYRVIYHRCRPLEEGFYRGHPEASKLHQEILPLEEQIFDWTTGRSSLTQGEYGQLIEKLSKRLKRVEMLLQNYDAKSAPMPLKALEYRLLGLLLADVYAGQQTPTLFSAISSAYQKQKQKKKFISGW